MVSQANRSEFHWLFGLPTRHWFWVALVSACICLELAALFYQHVLGLLPCELCIYVRVWVLSIAVVGLFGLLLRSRAIALIVVGLAGLGLSAGLANETWNLVKVEYGIGDGGSCGFFANFPAWAPLDKWLPAVFEVQELCQATPEIVLGITMTDSLIVFSAMLLVAFALSLVAGVKSAFANSQ